MTPRRAKRTLITLGGSALILGTLIAVNPATAGRGWADNNSAILAAEGGSFAEPVINKLQADQAAVQAIGPLVPQFFDADIDLARDDFAAGVTQTGQTVDYAVSEVPLTDPQAATAAQSHRSFAYVPFAASPLAFGTNVLCSQSPSLSPASFCRPLKLTVLQLAKIFTFGLTTWNTAELTQENPSLSGVLNQSVTILPTTAVQPSASNLVVESMFVNNPSVKPLWDQFIKNKANITDDTPSEHWPNRGDSGGDSGLAQTLVPPDPSTSKPLANPPNWPALGSLAALPVEWLAPPRDVIPTIAIQNAAGAFVSPTVDATAAALNDATMDPKTNLVTFQPSQTDQAAYPLVVMSYLVVPTSGLDPTKATALAAFVRFVLSTAGQADVKATGAAPPTPAMVSAGLHVADLVAAQAQTSATTSTTTPATTSTTAAGGSTSGQGSSGDAGGGGAGNGLGNSATPASDNGSQLAFTGGAPVLVPLAGAGMVGVGVLARRAMRRRLLARSSGS